MNLQSNDTIVAPATTAGSGALAIIRISGPDSVGIADRLVSFYGGRKASGSEGYALMPGIVRFEDGSPLDEVMVSICHAPKSYTGEDCIEITCHSSVYIVREILRLCMAAGARSAAPGEFTMRAFMNGKMDLAQAEAVADIIGARSESAHRIALTQFKGGYSAELRSLRDRLADLASMLELEIDFSEEEVEFASRSRLKDLAGKTLQKVKSLCGSFALGNVLKDGVPVVLAGAANSGKSTLLNALLGHDRAIVSDIEGTTRDTVEETADIGGILFRFIDTAGLRDSEDKVEKLGIERSMEAIKSARFVLCVCDSSADPESARKQILQTASMTAPDQCFAVVMNKIDLGKSALLPVNKNVIQYNNFISLSDLKPLVFTVSAKERTGVRSLEKWLEETVKSETGGETGSIMVTNARHYEALSQAGRHLENVLSSLDSGISSDLLAEDLRSAIDAISSILGDGLAITTDEILGNIFSKHCIGK